MGGLRVVTITASLGLLAAIGLGTFAQHEPSASRSKDLTTPVSAGWYRALPQDAELATKAFLDRIPGSMRERGEQVSRSRYWVLLARIVVNLGALLIFLFSGAAGALEAAVARVTRYRFVQALLFTFALFVYVLAITLPVEVYAGYVRYRRFGFADRPFAGWLQDDLTNWLVLTVFYVVGVAALMAVMRRSPKTWFLWAGVIYLGLAGLYTAATPALIEPLTNRYTPLPESEIKSEILQMARTAGIRADNVYTEDASRQSRMLNAHVSGIFGTARISIDDATLEGQYLPALKAVVGHEIGHFVEKHLLKMVLFSSVVATLGFALIAWAGPLLISHFGLCWRTSQLQSTAGIATLWLLFLCWGFVSDPIINSYTRVQESQADDYGLNLSQAPEGMAEFMIHDADIARLDPTGLDVLLFYDHPSDASRVRNAMRWRAAHMR
jgi:STE24 endopeptidase